MVLVVHLTWINEIGRVAETLALCLSSRLERSCDVLEWLGLGHPINDVMFDSCVRRVSVAHKLYSDLSVRSRSWSDAHGDIERSTVPIVTHTRVMPLARHYQQNVCETHRSVFDGRTGTIFVLTGSTLHTVPLAGRIHSVCTQLVSECLGKGETTGKPSLLGPWQTHCDARRLSASRNSRSIVIAVDG